ncbi:MAG: FtsX-like permease family protein [bacterium]|nr:FtsX-like permease family protein [bacterium]
MFKNYLKITFRNIIRYKGYSSINILGLAFGFACCIFILLFVQYELNYDGFFDDSDRIFRVVTTKNTEAGTNEYSMASMHVGPALKENFPQILGYARLTFENNHSVKYEDRLFYYNRNITFADQGFFDIFSIPFIEGDRSTALNRPNTVVITERTAERIFGDEKPLGKVITIDDDPFEVTGIIENYPQDTHLKFDVIATLKYYDGQWFMDNWQTVAAWSYIKISPETDVEQLAQGIRSLVHNYISEVLASSGTTVSLSMLPLKDIHLSPARGFEIEPKGNKSYIYIFICIGILIILIASMNFMNLTTARSANRAGEIGLRKVVGARRFQIIRQFIGESLLISIIALMISVVLVAVLLPFFNNLTETYFEISDLLTFTMVPILILVAITVGLLAGSYPAFFLSAFKPVSVLKGKIYKGSRGAVMREVLVVGQFIISITLIISTLVIYRQIGFMKHYPLGFEKEQKIVLTFPESGTAGTIADSYETLKQIFTSHSSVLGATASSQVPGKNLDNIRIWPSEDGNESSIALDRINIDHDFLSVFNIELAAGRPFMKEMGSDTTFSGFILNEAAVRTFGWSSGEEAIQKEFNQRFPVIGVTKDFYTRGVQYNIEPLILVINPNAFRHITLSIQTVNIQETLDFIEQKWIETLPNIPFEYFFLDTEFENQYRFEEKVGKIFSIFTFLGVFIACLGLIGLAAHVSEQRTKEIGIRKVLGASVMVIISLLTKEFIKWLLIGMIIAWPIGYIVMTKWLQNFAQRIDIGLLVFISSGIISIIISILTVGYQAARSALMNPVDILRNE